MNFFGDSQKCGDVVKLLANHNISYSDGMDFESFIDCSAVMIAVDATTRQARMEPYIFDY